MATQPIPDQTPRYIAVWVPPDTSLHDETEIVSGDDENAVIAAAIDYDAPAAGHIELRHHTPAGRLIGTRRIERDGDSEDEAETAAQLHAAADELEHDLDQEVASGPVNETDDALFDPADYQTEELALPTVDGHSVAKIGVNLQGGLIWLDRSSAEDVAVVRDLHVGQRVRFLIEGVVGVPKPGYSTSKGGDLDVIYLARNFKATGLVQAVSQPAEQEESDQ